MSMDRDIVRTVLAEAFTVTREARAAMPSGAIGAQGTVALAAYSLGSLSSLAEADGLDLDNIATLVGAAYYAVEWVLDVQRLDVGQREALTRSLVAIRHALGRIEQLDLTAKTLPPMLGGVA